MQQGPALGKTLMLTDVMSLADPWWLGAPEPPGRSIRDNFQCIGMKWACFDRCQALLAFTPPSGLSGLWETGDGPTRHGGEMGDGHTWCWGDLD